MGLWGPGLPWLPPPAPGLPGAAGLPRYRLWIYVISGRSEQFQLKREQQQVVGGGGSDQQMAWPGLNTLEGHAVLFQVEHKVIAG